MRGVAETYSGERGFRKWAEGSADACVAEDGASLAWRPLYLAVALS